MRFYLAYFILALGFFSPGVLNCLLIRHWIPAWWKLRVLRVVLWGALVVSAALLVLSIVAPVLHVDPSRTMLGLGLAIVWLPQAALLGTLPLVVLWLKLGERRLRRTRDQSPSTVDRGRRAFLHTSAAALPLAAVGTSVMGITAAVGGAKTELKPLSLPELPSPLRGLRILQLSDLHLGGFMMIDFLAETLNNAREHHPDLIVITGDFADDYSLLPEALKMLENFRAPLGVWATLGNHEYGNGLEEFTAQLEDSAVRLLINEGYRIQVGASTLFLAGVDDILGRRPGEDPLDYLERCVESALAGRQTEDFSVLLSHRPNVFDAAADQQIPLTLAGHTHGGQAALAGRSWLQWAGIEQYAWGFYHRNDSLLYTSSGAGQWVPVRLGCPTEAPVFELG